MKENLILFNAEMVKEILSGNKTQTRRIISKKISDNFDLERDGSLEIMEIPDKYGDLYPILDFCKFGKIGDILWVREHVKIKSYHYQDDSDLPIIQYSFSDGKLGEIQLPERFFKNGLIPKWVHNLQVVPYGCIKEMCRIHLKITNVRVGRIFDITEGDAIAEGFKSTVMLTESGEVCNGLGASEHFFNTWESIYHNLDSNPWVWVITFEVSK